MGVATVVQIEWGETGAGLHAVVVSKLGSHEVVIPMLLVGGDIGTQHVLNCSVSTFCLPICLGMVGCGHFECSAEASKECSPKMRGESGIPIRDEGLGKAKVAKNVGEEKISIACCVDVASSWDKNDSL